MNTGLSSLTHHHSIEKKLFEYAELKTYKVQTSTWKSFVKKKNLKNVDFMIIDTEGHEVEVLEGMKDCDVLPDVICIEFAMSDRSKPLGGAENFSGIIKLNEVLRDMGYVFDYVNYNNAMFSKKKMWEGKERPNGWYFEDQEFNLWGTTWYDKEKLKSLLSEGT